jgi:hypothetical protein
LLFLRGAHKLIWVKEGVHKSRKAALRYPLYKILKEGIFESLKETSFDYFNFEIVVLSKLSQQLGLLKSNLLGTKISQSE